MFTALLILATCEALFSPGSAIKHKFECTAIETEECSCEREIQNSTEEIVERLTSVIENIQCNCCNSTPRSAPATMCPCIAFETNLPLPCCTNGTQQNPADSCQDLATACSCATSGNYWIRNVRGDAVLVYCDMAVHADSRSCGSSRGWMRVANLDMTNTQCNTCPHPLITIHNGTRRLCTRRENRRNPGCASVPYNVQGVEYSRVCGRVIGYQRESPDAFKRYIESQTTIDEEYVDGVSITHGQSGSRTHIWTFAAAQSESEIANRTCPCTQGQTLNSQSQWRVPEYVGENFFCETGSRNTGGDRFYFDDPLWDGQGCGSGSTCCENRTAYFRRKIPATTDDVDVRLCAFFRTGNELQNGIFRFPEDTPLEVIELYVQ